MPSPAETFQGIADPQQGPFGAYLRPMAVQPIQPTALDRPLSPATGWESGPVGAGKIALNFLQGIRQRKVASVLENEARHQQALNDFQSHVHDSLNDPRLTNEGRQKIQDYANGVMHEYGEFQTRDVPKEGITGVFQKIFQGATGGPVKSRKDWQPEDFHAAMGQVSNIAKEHNQEANYSKLVSEGQQTVDQLKATNPNLTSEDIQRALLPTYQKMVQQAPNYADTFLRTMSLGYPAAGSFEGISQQLYSTPRTAPPPRMDEFSRQVQGGTVFQPGIEHGGTTGEPPRIDQFGRPVVATTPPPQAEASGPAPGSPQRYALLTGAAGLRNSPIAVSTQEPFVTESGKRFMGHQIQGSRNPADNGIWNAETGEKIDEPAVRVSLSAGATQIDEATGIAMRPSPFDPNKMVPVMGADGKPFKPQRAPIAVMDASSPSGYRLVSPSESIGKTPAAVGISRERSKAWLDTQRSLLGIREDDQTARAGSQLRTANEKWHFEERQRINSRYNAAINQAKDKAINEAAGMPGAGSGPELAKKAMANVQPLIDTIEAQRTQELKDADAAHESQLQTIAAEYGEATAPRTTAPRTAAPPAAKPGPEAKTAAPPASGVVKGSDLLK